MKKSSPSSGLIEEAKEAAEFYVSVFPESKIRNIQTLTDTPSGTVESVYFTLWGHDIGAMSAGPYFKLNPSISISVQCRSEEEIDRIHASLMEGGTELMPLDWYPWDAEYVWLNDRYGVSWQLNFFKDQSVVKERISPAFLFTGTNAGKAEEAMKLYTTVFPNSSIDFVARYEEGESEKDAPGSVKHAEFTLSGQTFMVVDSALDHKFTFNEAFSLMIYCKDQEEIDFYWNSFVKDGGQESMCGWLKDKYGVSWQVIPREMDEMMEKGSKEQIARVTQALLQMKKFDLATLRAAYGE